MAECKCQRDFLCSVASAFDALTKVSIECQCVVIASFFGLHCSARGAFKCGNDALLVVYRWRKLLYGLLLSEAKTPF